MGHSVYIYISWNADFQYNTLVIIIYLNGIFKSK